MERIAIVQSTNYNDDFNAYVMNVVKDDENLKDKFRSEVERLADAITDTLRLINGDDFEPVSVDGNFTNSSQLEWRYECPLGDDADYPLIYSVGIQHVHVED